MQTLTPQQFVARWRTVTLTERSASQQHFLDLCALVGHPTPAQDDPTGERFTFEAGAAKSGGGQGWADVYKRDFFAWEYKGLHANLERAYQQLLKYRESLRNPPLLVVSDMHQIVVHPNFVNRVNQPITITLDDLTTPDGMRALRAIFYDPDQFRSTQTTEQVTQEAAKEFANLADHLRASGAEPSQIAHFLIRLLFSLFAEDIELLPKTLFSQLIALGLHRSPSALTAFDAQLQRLFEAMAHGGFFGVNSILHFNGGLFDDTQTIPLDRAALEILDKVARLDWSSIEPSIFGTLFERSLDPDKRSQLGAHYTSKEDILLIVEPVLMQPLRRQWEATRAAVQQEAARRDAAIQSWQQRTDRTPAEISRQIRTATTNAANAIEGHLLAFLDALRRVCVLDPACGSGNFLYVALRQLLDLEKEAITTAGTLGVSGLFPQVNPEQLYGIEINPYAHELAQATVWIGYIQWLHENGFGVPAEPILKPLNNIRNMDAILAYDDAGNPVEPEWPEADVIIGNPPFLGGNKVRQGLGDHYVEDLFVLYANRVPGFADLVCYWFEKARHYIQLGIAKRAGLLATQGIRGGANRQVLDRIKTTGDIFLAYSDRNWVLDGATVHVSIVGFDDGSEKLKRLDEHPVETINSNLQAGADVTQAVQLSENGSLAFIGDTKKGKFDIPESLAREWLGLPLNPNGKSNADVLRPWINGLDLTGRPRNMWIIDFGVDMTEAEASFYEAPFKYVQTHVKPARDEVRNQRERELWWIHGRPAPDLRMAIASLNRYIATPRVSKHRLFLYVSSLTIPDGQVVVIARQDDYFLGVLHSRVHETWARATGTQLREAESGFRYSQTMTFETFPFPWPPGTEDPDDPRVQAIAAAAAKLVEHRDRWLNPPDATAAELKKRTLTNLYNQRPTWLQTDHADLDRAVFAAYGWSDGPQLSDEEILSRLLALNLERASTP